MFWDAQIIHYLSNKGELSQDQKSIMMPIHNDDDDINCSNYRGLWLNHLHTIFYPSYHLVCFRKILQKKWGFNEAVNQLFIHFNKACGSLKMEFLIMSLFSLASWNISLVDEMCLGEIYSKMYIIQISNMHIFYQEWSETCRHFNIIHFNRYFVMYH